MADSYRYLDMIVHLFTLQVSMYNIGNYVLQYCLKETHNTLSVSSRLYFVCNNTTILPIFVVNMVLKVSVILLCLASVVCYTSAFVKRDVSSQTTPSIVDSFQKNMDHFKNCIDHGLAKAVDDVNIKQLQPIFAFLEDRINRVSKAFDDLTKPAKSEMIDGDE